MIHFDLFFFFFFFLLISKESGQGTEFLKRLQEIEINEQQQQENFNQEVDILDIYMYVLHE
jgi:hypothetical protein